MGERMLTPREVADELRVDTDAVYDWIASGEIEAEDMGRASQRRWRISRAALAAFRERRRATLNRESLVAGDHG